MSGTQINYQGKKCVVVGASSGVGESATKMLVELGAEVYAVDLNPTKIPGIKAFVQVNLGNEESVNAAVAALPDGIDSYIQTAGIAGVTYGGHTFSPLDVVTINFIGSRHLIEGLIPKMNEGAAIVITTSVAGSNWRAHIQDFKEFVYLMDWKAAQDWVMARADDPTVIADPHQKNRPYEFSKECLSIYMAFRSWELSDKKIRINTISPAGISTPMHDDFNTLVGKTRGTKLPTSGIGEEATGEQVATVLLGLNSDMADYISGVDVPVDYGITAAIVSGRFQTIQKNVQK